MAADIGAVFEAEVKKVLDLLKQTHLVAYHRFSDSKAAGSIVAAQPADYLVALPPGVSLAQRMGFLEVKASEKYTTLQKASVRPSQRGAIGVYRMVLGLPYFILFWDAQNGVIQLWDGMGVHGEGRLDKAGLLAEWKDCGTLNRLITSKVAAALADYFQIPPAAVTLRNLGDYRD